MGARSTWWASVSAALALTVLGWLLVAGPVGAHATLVSSTTAQGEQLDAAPPGVTLVFSGELEPTAEVAVTGPDGTSLVSGVAIVSGDTIIQRVSDQGGAGQYSLAYEVTSADGHLMTGQVDFAVGEPVATGRTTVGPGEEQPDGAAAGSEADADGGGPALGSLTVWIAAGLLVVALAAWVLVRRAARAAK